MPEDPEYPARPIPAKCPRCGLIFTSNVYVGGDMQIETSGNATSCPRCGALVVLPAVVYNRGHFYTMAEHVAASIAKASDPADLVRRAKAALVSVKTGKDLSTARSNGSLAVLKRYGLMPRSAREAGLLAVILSSIIKWWVSNPEKEKKREVPPAQTIVNIYNEQTGGDSSHHGSPHSDEHGKPKPAEKGGGAEDD